MSKLDEALNEYLSIRRALGFELREVAGCLRNFVAFQRLPFGMSGLVLETAPHGGQV